MMAWEARKHGSDTKKMIKMEDLTMKEKGMAEKNWTVDGVEHEYTAP